MKRANRRFHDRIARCYDRVYDTAYWRFYRELSWRHTRRFLPVQRPARAADLGCGTGWFGRKLLRSGLDVGFVDPSGVMLAKCRDLAEPEARGRELRFVQSGLEDLRALETASLDFATAQGDPLSFCASPRRALAEIRRVLRPGGALVVSVDSRVSGLRALRDASGDPDELLALLASGRTRWRTPRTDESFPLKMFEPAELHGLLERAGFAVRSTIAKTCLVSRENEGWLADPETRRRLLAAEERVHARPWYFALAGHFEVAARRA